MPALLVARQRDTRSSNSHISETLEKQCCPWTKGWTSWTKARDSLEADERGVACTQLGAGEAGAPGSQQGWKEGQGRGEREAWRQRRSLFPRCPPATGHLPTLRQNLLPALARLQGVLSPSAPGDLAQTRVSSLLTPGDGGPREVVPLCLACPGPWSTPVWPKQSPGFHLTRPPTASSPAICTLH